MLRKCKHNAYKSSNFHVVVLEFYYVIGSIWKQITHISRNLSWKGAINEYMKMLMLGLLCNFENILKVAK